MTAHDCAQLGHVWLEGTTVPSHPRGLAAMTLFQRHSGRGPGPVTVVCYFCRTTTEIEGHSAHTIPRTNPGPARMGAD